MYRGEIYSWSQLVISLCPGAWRLRFLQFLVELQRLLIIMFNPFLNIAKLSAQYVLSYWTSQVNYTMFIKLILYFDQEWKHNSQWDQVLLLSQLLFLTLRRWGQEKQNKTKTLTAKIFRLHRERKKAKCRWALEISGILYLILFRFLSGNYWDNVNS